MTGAPGPDRSVLPPYVVLPEPVLTFAPGGGAARHVHPLSGLLAHGPYARPAGLATVRVATITVEGQEKRLFGFLSRLREAHEPTDRKAYLPRYPGFQAVFGVDVAPARPTAHVSLRADAPGDGPDGHERLFEKVARAVALLHSRRDEWDVIVFLLPARWETNRRSPDGALDLHDRIKAVAAPLGCPVQWTREASALAYKHTCSLAWRLSTALFVKAGGTPWRIQPTSSQDTAYVGLAYAIRAGGAFVTCCSQVFDAEGGGMEFVAYNVGAERDLTNPHLTRDEMRAVMARSARLYQDRHAGRMPARLVVHKTTRWRDDEVDGVLDAWAACSRVDCVTIQAQAPWRGVSLVAAGPDAPRPSRPDGYPVRRGTMQHLSGRSALLWVKGTAEGLALRGGKYYQTGKGIPTPALLVRDCGSGPLEEVAADVLALSKLDWNNDSLFDPMPVTIKYSHKLAEVIAHVPDLPDSIYPYRLFM